MAQGKPPEEFYERVLEAMCEQVISLNRSVFNRSVAEDIKEKVEHIRFQAEWSHKGPVHPDYLNGKCIHCEQFHAEGECPDDVIDATFKEDEPLLLPSGKEEQ